MRIKNLKSSIRTFNQADKYSNPHVELMLDRSTGEVWTDEVFGYYQYENSSVINLGRELRDRGYNCTDYAAVAEEVAKDLCDEFARSV